MSEEQHEGKPALPAGGFWLGFFIGGLLGAVILFFLGTKEGKRTGRLLESRTKDFLGELEGKIDEMEEKGKELARQGEQIKADVLEKIEEKKEVLTSGATQKLDSALAHIEAIQEKGVETTAEIRKKLFKNIPKKSS